MFYPREEIIYGHYDDQDLRAAIDAHARWVAEQNVLQDNGHDSSV
jgi:hypothetical protein